MAEYSDVFCGGNGIKSATGWRIQTILCQRNMRTCTIKRKGPPYWHPVRDPRRTGKRTTVLFTSRSQGFPRYNGDYTSGGVLKKLGFLSVRRSLPSYDSCVEWLALWLALLLASIILSLLSPITTTHIILHFILLFCTIFRFVKYISDVHIFYILSVCVYFRVGLLRIIPTLFLLAYLKKKVYHSAAPLQTI